MSSRFRAAAGDDHGAALVSVIGVMVVLSIVVVSLATGVIYNAGTTSESRAVVQANAAADAGIDIVLSEIQDTKFQDLPGLCSSSHPIGLGTVDVDVDYELTDGSVIDCPTGPAQAASVSRLLVTSTADVTNSVRGHSIERSVVAEVNLTPEVAPGVPAPALDKALFGESFFTLTNDTVLSGSASGVADAHVYSNGGLDCKTQVPVAGSVYAAHGNLRLENNCDVKGTAWAEGYVEMSSNASVSGDLYSASTRAGSGQYAVSMKNQAKILGNLLTNGNVLLEENNPNPKVTGSVVSTQGLVRMTQNGPKVGGSVYAHSTITLGNHARIGKDAVSRTGSIAVENSGNVIAGNARARGSIASSNLTVNGSRTTGSPQEFPGTLNPAAALLPGVGYPTTIAAPAREEFPRLLEGASGVGAWTAAGWAVRDVTGKCTSSQVEAEIESAADRTMLRFSGCSTGIKLENATVSLQGHVAVVSTTGMVFANENRFTASGPPKGLFLMVPADAPGVTWSTASAGHKSPVCSPARNIDINKIGMTGVEMFMYTPCTVKWQNGLISGKYTGQIYAGKLELPNKIDLVMKAMPVPGAGAAGGSGGAGAPAPTDTFTADVVARYDVTG